MRRRRRRAAARQAGHRDFGPNGKIDRLTYYISVKPEDVERAKELLADLVKPEHVAPQ